uniref:Holin n=1 Tax=Geladintestivirus 6 TaxID=3233138 RepID=A0AAU8MJ85_9CAUD
MEYISQIINTTIESFDFGFCVAVNILTYLIIKLIDEINGSRKVTTWTKRSVMLIAVIVISIAYYITGNNPKLIINSAILAPVFWSWIGKPICDKFNIGYRKDNNK